MRLIDADALKKEIRENDPFGGMNYEWYIDNAPTIVHASPWHRVEDGLPPDNRFVLVCNDDHRYGVAQYVGDDGLTPWQIAYCLYDVDLWDDEEQGPVRYWMPIEPPKEENNGSSRKEASSDL